MSLSILIMLVENNVEIEPNKKENIKEILEHAKKNTQRDKKEILSMVIVR